MRRGPLGEVPPKLLLPTRTRQRTRSGRNAVYASFLLSLGAPSDAPVTPSGKTKTLEEGNAQRVIPRIATWVRGEHAEGDVADAPVRGSATSCWTPTPGP